MTNYYETTKIVNPCDKCDGAKFVEDYYAKEKWAKFQQNFAKIREDTAIALSAEELAEIRNEMPNKPLLITCDKCNGNGSYEKKINLRDAIIEIMSDANFEGVIQSNREFERQQNEAIPY